jgi:hypothetical protein
VYGVICGNHCLCSKWTPRAICGKASGPDNATAQVQNGAVNVSTKQLGRRIFERPRTEHDQNGWRESHGLSRSPYAEVRDAAPDCTGVSNLSSAPLGVSPPRRGIDIQENRRGFPFRDPTPNLNRML